MWYFTWILGLGFALTFGVLNGMWHEYRMPPEDERQPGAAAGH